MSETTLTNRVLIRVSGEDVRGFLDGLITNKLDFLPAYAALLTPQGKVIADFIVWDDGEDVLLDCDVAAAETLEKRLAMYRLRRAIVIARDEALAVHWSPEGNDDPRLSALGRRWIAPPGTVLEKGLSYPINGASIAFVSACARARPN